MLPAKAAVALHAGAGSLSRSRSRLRSHRKILNEVGEESFLYLKNHSALETAVFAVKLLEDLPQFNAGTGCKLQEDGKARMSASVMDGKTLSFAAVVNIERVKNPVAVARLLLDEKDRILAGEGALHFARAKGFPDYDPVRRESRQLWKEQQSRTKVRSASGDFFETVGACALDAEGDLAAATSTGGRGFEQIGRVSDSATPCGNYANSWAAVSATGIGEDIVDEALASRLVLSVSRNRSLKDAFLEIFKECWSRKRLLGAIGLDRSGTFVWQTTTEILLYCFRNRTRTLSF